MKINLNRMILLCLVAVGAFSCKKQLDIHPAQSIDASSALTSRDAIDASIASIYSRLKNVRQYGKDLIALPEALADNGYATNKSGRLLNESNNVAGAHFTGTIWSNSYAAINQINLTLEALPALNITPAVSAAEKAKWEGQLYFLRGLFLFDLTRVYAYIPGAVVSTQDRGGVPIITNGIASSDSALLFKPARPSIDDDYAQVISDFQAANSRLLIPGSTTSFPNLASKAAAQALLARVNLYRKNYAEAKRWADSCIAIAGSRMTTTGTYVTNWRNATHGETLFQVVFTTNSENIGVNESLQTSFTTLTAPGNAAGATGGFGDLVPTLSLLTDLGITIQSTTTPPVVGNTSSNFTTYNASIASRSNDVRNLLYEPGTTGRGKSYVECTKYMGKNGFINLDNIPVIRIAEVYLIRAEAMATPGSSVLNPVAALADLKVIKSNRYTGYTGTAQETADDALTASQLYDEIIRQRRIELAFEGDRFFTFKRLGRDIVKSAPSTATIAFTDFRILPAIPQADVDGNPNLKQNFGY